jgi:acyl-CoA synthetase (AMP-forming)/AMP-acid ligase II
MALFTANSVDTPVVTFGTLWAAGIVSPASPRYTAEELASQLKDCSAAAMITQYPMLEVALQAAKVAGIPRERIILIGDVRDPETRVRHFTNICGGPNSGVQERPLVTPKKDPAYLMYSSGTTGYPKGALLSHHNIVSNVLQTHAVEGHQLTHNGGKDGRGDRVLIFLPLFHIYGKRFIPKSLYL